MLDRSADLDAFEERIGVRFRDRALLERALTHSSYANDVARSGEVKDNETLEFLGDSVLGMLVAELLVETLPDVREGTL